MKNAKGILASYTLAVVMTLTGCSQSTTTVTTIPPASLDTTSKLVAPISVSTKSFKDYVNDMKNNPKETLTKEPDWTKFAIILDMRKIIDPCPPKPDGPCGLGAFIVASRNWDKIEGNQTFYFQIDGGTGNRFYGPYQDNLKSIVAEAMKAGGIFPTPDNQ